VKGSAQLKIGFIGAGKVGTNLASYFADNGLIISGFFVRTDTSINEEIKKKKFSYTTNLKDFIDKTDVIFITVNDDQISAVVEMILQMQMDLSLKTFAHTSGSLSAQVLSPLKEKNADVFTFHPLQTFSSYCISNQYLKEMHIFVENKESMALTEILEMIMNQYHVIDTQHKSKYHLAASVISNLTTGLIDFGFDLLDEIGMDRENSIEAFRPLILGTTNSILSKGPKLALTGPVSRGDSETVKQHLECLEGDSKLLYVLLAKKTLQMSKDKITEEQYNRLFQMLKESENNG
jgi:predicted short-subunit dehydrogenase-like oxidoreductase (DUF2520 family)